MPQRIDLKTTHCQIKCGQNQGDCFGENSIRIG